MSPEVPAVLEGRKETEPRSTHPLSRGSHCRPPSSLQHLDHTELPSVSQLCPAHDIMKRKRDCMAQKNPIEAAAQNGSPCPPHVPRTVASLVVSRCLSLSLSLRSERWQLQRWKRAGLMGDLGADTLISASVATSGKKTHAKHRLLCWCCDVQSGVKQSGLMVVRGPGCCMQQPNSS